jgi:hypothetical protein
MRTHAETAAQPASNPASPPDVPRSSKPQLPNLSVIPAILYTGLQEPVDLSYLSPQAIDRGSSTAQQIGMLPACNVRSKHAATVADCSAKQTF